MVADDIAMYNLFICCKAFRTPQHKSGQCRTFVLKYISLSEKFVTNKNTVAHIVICLTAVEGDFRYSGHPLQM